MQTPINGEESVHYKRQVAQRFDRASLTYDAYADFQRVVLERLFSDVPIVDVRNVLDVGTGTGQALSKLARIYSPLVSVALDLSFQMLEKASAQPQNQSFSFVCADAELLPFVGNTFDLIFSNLAMQWCLNPQSLFAELYRTTLPGGYLVFSTLCEGSMPEIEIAWQGIDQTPHINHYPAFETILKQVNQCHWQTVSAVLKTVPMWFDSPENAIHSLRKVGANLVVSNNKSTLSPTKWKAFINQYEQLRESAGIPLRYQVAFIVLQKPFS